MCGGCGTEWWSHSCLVPWQCRTFTSCLLSPCDDCSSVAKEVEDTVRTNGAVPAVIGILNGYVHVGLQNEELEFLAKSQKSVKVSRRDLPFVLSQVLHADPLIWYCFAPLLPGLMCNLGLWLTVLWQGLSGGTTVAATMIVAHKAGIPVFVTGGIGGVHRGGEKSKRKILLIPSKHINPYALYLVWSENAMEWDTRLPFPSSV